MKGQGGGGTAKGGGRLRSGGGTTTISKSSARKTKAINENILTLRNALFTPEGKDKNILNGIAPAFLEFNKNGINLSISLKYKLSKEELSWAFELTKLNMEDIYDSCGYGWDDCDKREELSENGARFLLIRDVSIDSSSKIVGFVHFRFTVQGEVIEQMVGDTTLAVWDIQIEEGYRRKGLGKHLMVLLELIARREMMSMISLAVYDCDSIGKSWASNLKGYSPDVGLSIFGFDPEEEGYDIICKKFVSNPRGSPNTITPPTNNGMKIEEPSSVSTSDQISSLHSPSIELASTSNLDQGTETDIVRDQDPLTSLSEDELINQLKQLFLQEHKKEADECAIAQWRETLSQALATENGSEREEVQPKPENSST